MWQNIADLWLRGSLPDGKEQTLPSRKASVLRSGITKTDIKPVHTMPEWMILECGRKVLAKKLCLKTVTEEVNISLQLDYSVGSPPQEGRVGRPPPLVRREPSPPGTGREASPISL